MEQAVLEQVAASEYARLWRDVWGEPVSYDTEDEVVANYARIGATPTFGTLTMDSISPPARVLSQLTALMW